MQSDVCYLIPPLIKHIFVNRLIICLALVAAVGSCRKSDLTDSAYLSLPMWNDYDRFKEPLIVNRFVKHTDIVSLIEKHEASGLLRNEVAGTSVQGRTIHHLTIGKGEAKVLLWSQMHGDESTATMALFDLLNFFGAKDVHDSLRQFLLSKLELHVIPMLNPDGAEVWQRRNAFGIDINRDARLLATPEGRTLMKVANEVKPSYGFNLHDQSIYYTAGVSRRPATISFLSPAYNDEKSMNDVRSRATQLIVVMNEALQSKIPGHIAKYDDTYDGRCFGDTFQGKGISTILIESGGYPDDPEKQTIRRLNFYALLTALESIARGDYSERDVHTYDTIPENRRSLYDCIVRNVRVERDGQEFTTNLGIGFSQIKAADFRSVRLRGVVEEMGDLTGYFGYRENDARGLKFAPGRTKVMTARGWNSLTNAEEMSLLRQGYLFVRIEGEKSELTEASGRSIMLIDRELEVPSEPRIGSRASFLLMEGETPKHAVINGLFVDLTL